MDYTPAFQQAFSLLKPEAQPQEIGQAYLKLKQALPQATEQDLVDAVEGAGAVTGRIPPTQLSPGAAKQYEMYSAPERLEQQVADAQAKVQQIDQGIMASQQNLSSLQQQWGEPPQGMQTGPEDLAAAQQQVMDRRNPGAETVGHMIAALGGKGSQDTYNNYISGKRRDEQQSVQNVKDRMSAETAGLRFQQAKDEYIEMRRTIAQKHKEESDRSDPNSAISQITRQLIMSQAESVPALKNIPGLEKMSAAEITKMMPALTGMVDLAQRKVDADRKNRESDAKIARENALAGKALAETNKINRVGQGGAADPDGGESIVIVDRQGNRIVQKEIAKSFQGLQDNANLAEQMEKPLQEALTVVDKAPSSTLGGLVADVSSLTETTKTESAHARETLTRATNQAVGMLAAIDPRAKGAPSNADIQGIKDTIQRPDASPAEKRKAIETVLGWVRIMKEEYNTAYGSLDNESRNKLRPYGIERKTSTPPAAPAGGKTITMAEIQKRAAENGWEVQEMVDHIKSKGWEIK